MLQRKPFSICVLFAMLLNGTLPTSAQVTLQTGSAVYSLPMFNWQDNKSRLTSGISLNYSSGNGLKVNDVASNEGQGWNLVAGGVISRIQVGEPDDQPANYGNQLNLNDQDLTKYPAGILYDTIPITRGCPDALTQYPTYGAENVLYAQHPIVGQDRQMDRFAFQFNGKAGMFVIDTTGGWHGVTLGDSKMQISLQLDPNLANQGIRTTITSFTITDVDGLIYKFTKHGLTKLLTTSFSSGDGSKPAAQPKISSGSVYCQSNFDDAPTGAPWWNANISNPFIISNWYLSEVDDPFTSRKISISYDSLNLSNSAGTDITYNQGTDNYIVITYKKSISTTQEIASITYPDSTVVTFNYAATPRADYPGQYALANVTITYKYAGITRYLSQYQLNTTYFILNRYGTPSTPYENSMARLCLRSVKKIGPDLKEDAPPYQFDYYTSVGSGQNDDFVPPPFCYSKDIWGYYNGNSSIAYSSSTPVPLNDQVNPYASLVYDQLKGLCFQHQNVTGTYYNANPGYAQNGLLKEIIYPTGGSLTYKYAQDTGSFISTPSTVMPVGGVHVSQTSSSDGGYSNGCGTPIVTNYNYVMNGAGSASSLWGVETPVNSVTSNNFWQEQKQTIHFSLSDGFGCKWHYIYPGILSQYEEVNIGEFQRIMNVLGPILGAISIITTIDDVVNVLGPETGPGEIVAVVIDIISYVLEFILSCPQQTKNTYNTVFYNFDLNGIAPLPAQFKRVEITESSGGIGKTVEQFTHGDPNDNTADYPLWFAAGTNVALSMKQRYAPWAYGLPKMISVYDVSGNLIKRTQNVYSYIFAQEELLNQGQCGNTGGPALSYKCQVINNHSERSDAWASQVQYDAVSYYLAAPSLTVPGNSGDMIADLYDTYTGHVNLSTTYERTYRTTDSTQYVQTVTNYYYNQGWSCLKNYITPQSQNYDLAEVTTTQSNGDVNYQYIYYPWSYNQGARGDNSGILDNLVAANIMSLPVTTQTGVIKAGSGTNYLLNEKVTEFTQLADNEIKPYRVLEQRFASPLLQGSFTGYGGPANGVTNYANYKIPQAFTYDNNSNMVGVQDEGNRLVTNIYSYNDKYLVASVSNANPSVDKPAYTSFEDTAMSRTGWTISGIVSFNTAQPSVTGNNNFALLSSAANSLSASGLNTATAYILSFWANNGNVTVTGGATLTKSAPTYNGFTYYEYSIAAGTSSVVLKDNTSTNANIDELRLYPVGARMHTSTYDPLIGKTSDCDENNRITYYTYDNLGRLQFMEDETHNIVRMYEYNNVSSAKQTGCPVTFANHAFNELLPRNNCGAGYQGSNVQITIPASQFTSSISQQDADIQTEIYFLTNAQTTANANGSCALIYHNTAQSQTDTTQSCNPGYVGGPVTYTVPAGTYSSIISQADANQQALNDIAANAQMYANLPANQNCVLTDSADWEWFPGDSTTPADPSYCTNVNGALPPVLMILMTDQNPNSPTYGQTMWENYGPNNACPAGNYYNVQESQAFTRNNCGSGYTGSSVTYTVPAGKYSTTTSLAAADQLALNDISANGQNYANANGTCTSNCNIVSATGFSMVTQSISSTPTTTTFSMVVTASGSVNWNATNTVAVITGSTCIPTANRNFQATSATPSGTVWTMNVNTGGQISIQLFSGTAPTSTVQFTNISFNK